MAERGAIFEVPEHGGIEGAYVVGGTGCFARQVAVFTGPEARERAEAYARRLNSGAARPSLRRTDPGFVGRTDPGRRGRGAPTV